MKCKIDSVRNIFIFLFVFFLAGPKGYADETVDSQQDDYFAIINQQKISATEYAYRFQKARREKFFHGNVSQSELDAFKKEVAEQLVLEVLLGQEARKRGLLPDTKKIDEELDQLDRKFSKADSTDERQDWEENRDVALPILKVRAEREELIEKLQERVKQITQPPIQEVRKYYTDNKDKFTEPQQWDVSMILLSVDPSSGSEVWDESVEKAEKILKKIHKGESFEDLARIHSGDESAVNGGHMGYMHVGMFGTPAQKVLNVMEPGEVSEPVVLLEGVALFRLNNVQEARLNTFKDVEERARDLLMRELGEKAWRDIQTELRQAADIKYSDLINKELKLNAASDDAS